MASKALRGLTIEIGGDTTELNKALDKVDKRTRSLSSELGEINKALKLDPGNTELLAQKQKVLADAISNTEEKLDTLKEAEKQVQAQFERGEVSQEQVRALRREIISTEKKLDGYRNAAKETAEAERRLADGADDAAHELDEQADKTKEADRASEDLDDSAEGLASGGLAALATAAAAAVTAIVALAEASREYRTAMGKLDTAFQNVGLSSEAATKTYESLQSVLGETDQAVEASSLLARMCDSEEELAEWTEILTGVYGTFGASLPVEGLAEAANETMRVGQVTGPLADALNWAAAEGETFGVTLKENIEFTELEKQKLDRLTESQKAEYEARKKQYEEIEAYNQSVTEAASAEDLFNIALANCTNEQERQQLITDTLTRLYGSAAEQYKATSAEIIRSNQATEKWNKTTAKIGKTVEPVVTDIKELGTVLLEDAAEPLEDIADYIRKDVLPAIEKTGKWAKQNLPTIKAGLTGVATAMVAFKVATIATTVAQNGVKKAILATAAAQKVLNLVQSASPWGLAATAIAAVTVALVAYTAATKKAKKPIDVLTKEERELMKAAEETAEAFKEQKKATDEALGDVTAEWSNTRKLADELRSLANASGKVDEENRSRANFILGKLNEALGTEYKMVDGVILKYGELAASIDEAIRKELAFALTAEMKDDWVAAYKAKEQAMADVALAQKDYEQQLLVTEQAEQRIAAELIRLESEKAEALKSGSQFAGVSIDAQISKLKEELQTERDNLAGKKEVWEDASGTYQGYLDTINTYEAAQAAAMEGNYETAIDLLAKKGGSYSNYADTVDEETARSLDILKQEAIDAGFYAEWTREQFQNGVAGFTQPMVDEAQTNYETAMSEFENAYADAHAVGEDLSLGLVDGSESNRESLLTKARSLVTGFIEAARKAADSHSPSRKMIAFGEDLGEGAEIGVENKTEDVKLAATKQVGAVLDAYNGQEVNAQRALRSVAEQQTSRQMANQQAMASATSPMLEKILSAIEKGQIITLDGDALVGATANKMDNALGRRRALASRGAI